jgi:hypothetical protein
MADKSKTKKRKLEEENKVCEEKWTEKSFVGNKGSIIRLINKKENVSLPEKYNLRRHFETKHPDCKKSIPESSGNKE